MRLLSYCALAHIMDFTTGPEPLFPVYAFLAALVFFLSLSIIFSSFFLRRRQRLANSMRIPITPMAEDGTDLDEPDIFEVFLACEEGAASNGTESGHVYGQEDVHWDAIMPFSATYLPPRDKPDTSPTPSPAYPSTVHTSPRHNAYPSSTLTSLSPGSVLTTALAPNLALRSDTWLPSSMLRAVVLIAMPSVAPRGRHVEFGVVDVCVGDE